jgi:Transglycosylase SLT domain
VGSPEPGWPEYHAATKTRNAPAGHAGTPVDSPLRNAVPPAAPPSPAHRTQAKPRLEVTPAGRLIFSGLLISLFVTASGLSGAYLAPKAPAPKAPAAAQEPTGSPQSTAPGGGQPAPTESPAPVPNQPVPAVGRPADGLAGWAAPLASRLDIPPVAMEAYGYAEYVLAREKPSCQLRWTTLAGIGKIESNHGRAGATLRPDGRSQPPVIGPPLDGKNGRQTITDTDTGQLDHDSTWDHAIGPMQFLPSTWKAYAIDADRDGQADPYDIDDAALAAGEYLCSSGRDLSTAGGWWGAILAYNDVQAYAHDVFNAANDYGVRGG